MGMYTEIYINVDLVKDAPEEIILILKAICENNAELIASVGSLPRRWTWLFTKHSHYVPYTECAALTYNEYTKQWSLLGKGDIKNYEGEIEQFFKWLMPYIDGMPGDFIGYMRYEEDVEPTLLYKE